MEISKHFMYLLFNDRINSQEKDRKNIMLNQPINKHASKLSLVTLIIRDQALLDFCNLSSLLHSLPIRYLLLTENVVTSNHKYFLKWIV